MDTLLLRVLWELTNEFVDLETDLVDQSGWLVVIIAVVGTLGGLLEWLLDVVRLGGELLGLGSIVSDKYVVDWDDQLTSPSMRSLRLHRMSSVMVQSSIPIPAILVKSEGVLSSKKAGLLIFRGAHSPLYSGLGIFGIVHLPL